MSVTRARASLHTLGCRLNQAETALLADRLKKKGYELVEFGRPTDLFVLNTCSVTEEAEKECRYAIRQTLRHSPKAFVAITGCYAQTGVEALQSVPGIDMIIGTQFKMTLPEHLPDPAILQKQPAPHILHTRQIEKEEFTLPGTGDFNGTRAPLKIQDGCNFMCSFCLIPFARGRERSRRIDDVLREAEELVAKGHREVVLTGVNIGQYRSGLHTLVSLIRRLEAVHGLDRIRISSIEPTTVTDELLNLIASSSKLCPYLHIPLQSGDDGILRQMNRHYTEHEYRQLIDRALTRIPTLGLGTDVLVGFPGEGEQQFEQTVRLVIELPFSYCHVFTFSPRPGTAAARMDKQVTPATKKVRMTKLATLSRAKRLAYYQQYIGKTLSVLFERSSSERLATGLTGNFIKVGVANSTNLWNTLRDVTITGAMDGLAIGHLAAASCHRREFTII